MVGYKPMGTMPQNDPTVIKTGEDDGKGGQSRTSHAPFLRLFLLAAQLLC